MPQEFNRQAFGEALHLMRFRAKLSLRKLANIVGKSHSTIYCWERGKYVPKLHDFLYVCWFFELNPLDYYVPPTGALKAAQAIS